MSKKIFIALAATTVMAFSAQNADAAHLSGATKRSLARAIETGDEHTINAAIKAAKKKNPSKKKLIDSYVNNYNSKARIKAAAKSSPHPRTAHKIEQEPMQIGGGDLNIAAPAAAPVAANEGNIFGVNGLKGNVDAGVSIASGNTDSTNINVAGELNYVNGKYENKLTAKAVNDKSNKVRTKEQYLVNDKAKYNFTEMDYGFGEVNYDNDRYGAYNYQVTELVGYGRRLVKNPTTNVAVEVGVGARQTEFVNGQDESEVPVGKIGLDADHKITDTLQVGENASVVYGSEATVTTSDTWLKNQLSKSLYLKANFNVKNVSDVPPGVEETDTVTSINLGYQF